MDDELRKTVRLVRRGKVRTDDRGRSVWGEPVEDAELELVSTQMLERMLTDDDKERRDKLREAAEDRDGILARNTATNGFEIIDDDDLEAALNSAAEDTGPARVADVIYEPVVRPDDSGEEELSLVSTQMLRRMLGTEDETNKDEADDEPLLGGGFDPYNSG